jgi:Zn-dependent peptidase ImmA (M78 family)
VKEGIELNHNALLLRRKFGEDQNSPIDIFSLVNGYQGITLILHPMKNNISGMSGRIDKKDAYIAINSQHTYGRQRFTLAHELYHLYFQEKFNAVICGTDLEGNRDEEEMNADSFASYFLAPYDALKLFITENLGINHRQPLEVGDIVRIEQHFGMSRQATLVRLRWDNYILQQNYEELKQNVKSSARRLGYDAILYSPLPIDKQYFTSGRYITLAEELKEKEYISKGKYDELLLDAYRADIVYNLTDDGDYIYD